MNKKRLVNLLQNTALVILSVTALLLLVRTPLLDGAVRGQMRELLSSSESAQRREFDLTESVAAVHIAVTDDYEFGRYTDINVPTDGAEFQKLSPLLREAMGSATTRKVVTELEFRTALRSPGIYVDLAAVLPVSVVAAWLGEEFEGDDTVRAVALTTAWETATLYFLRGDGTLLRCESALTSSAVREIVAQFSPNGGQLAYESEHGALAPYTVLVREAGPFAQVNASLPAGYSAYNLLAALEFNPHTYARYVESGGTEVVLQSPHILRIGVDGTVRYSSSGEVTDELYRITGTDSIPTAAEALHGACVLASALSRGTDAAPLSLDAVEKTEQGWVISFCYRVDGVRVRLSEDRCALRVNIVGDTITEFEYYCRSYTALDESSVILPASMAAAVAAMHDGAELAVAYVDSGAGALSAHWFAE